MPSINVDLDYFTHPKTLRLVSLIGRGWESLPLRLWTFCGRHHRKTGQMDHIDAIQLENAIGWTGPRGKGVEALLTAGFLEEIPGGFVAHDFTEWQGHLEAFHIRAKKARAAQLAKIAGEPPTPPPREKPGYKPSASPALTRQDEAIKDPPTPQRGEGPFAPQSKTGRLWHTWTTTRRRRLRGGEAGEWLRFLEALPSDQARENCLQDAIDNGLLQLRKPKAEPQAETVEEYRARRFRLVTTEKRRREPSDSELLPAEAIRERIAQALRQQTNGTTNGDHHE